MPDSKVKNLSWSALTGVVAIVGTLMVQSMFAAAEEGSEALETQRITEIVEQVMDEKLVAIIDGKTYTYGEAFSLIHSNQTALTAAVGVLIE